MITLALMRAVAPRRRINVLFANCADALAAIININILPPVCDVECVFYSSLNDVSDVRLRCRYLFFGNANTRYSRDFVLLHGFSPGRDTVRCPVV